MRLAVAAALALVASVPRADPAAEAATAYRLEVAASPDALRVGQAGALRIAIRPEPKAHVHPEAPLKITLTATPGLGLAKQKLGRADLADPKAEAPRFEVALSGLAAGPQQASATVDFFICSDQWCVKQVREVKVDVAVR